MKRGSIELRLLLVGILVIAAISGAAGLVVEMQRRAAIDAFGTATTNLGKGMAQQTGQSLGAFDRALTNIQTNLVSNSDAAVPPLAAALRLKSTFDLLTEERRRLAGVDSLLVADSDGLVASTTRGWPATAANISGSDYFSHFRGADDHAVFVGKPVKEARSGAWTMFMARRLNGPDGGFAGIAAAEVSLASLENFYQLAMPPRRSVYVLRRDGVVLVRYPPRESEVGARIPERSPWYATLAAGGGQYHANAYFDPTPVIGVLQPLRNLPLAVEAIVTEADALAEWSVQRWWVAMGSVIADVGVILLLRLFGRQYRRVELSERSLAARNAELAITHGQLDATLANLSQGVCFFDEDSRLVVCNRGYREVYNLPEDAIRPGMSLRQVAALRVAAGSFTDRSIDEYLALVANNVRLGKSDALINKLTDGRTISAHLQPLPGRGWVTTIEDITDRCAAQDKIAYLARHDVLTGLANRSLFQERLHQALALTERGKGFALLCLDLDGFKAVNDTFGHPIGDRLLRAVTGRLLEAMRDSDTVARLGGDEFAILQVGVSEPSEVTPVARRIVESINDPFELEGHQVSIGTSIGIAMAPGDSSDLEQLMKAADLALYRAKQEGRGTWRYFEPAMDAAARTRRELEFDLRSALPLRQLELYYQPLVYAGDRSVTGFEALLRWHHPIRGMVAPDEFISVAEETGLIDEIGVWVLQQACAEAVTWPVHLRVSVNLSTRQFRSPALVREVADAMRNSGLAPERLELEITESVPLQESAATLATLQSLQALGSRIALDDFGTGYSSLSYLRGFPFDTIKIDRSFVGDLHIRDGSVALIRGIVGLAAKLRMNVTAEGVETEAQYDILVDAGCTEMQGFLIGTPVPVHEIPGVIDRLSGRRVTALAW